MIFRGADAQGLKPDLVVVVETKLYMAVVSPFHRPRAGGMRFGNYSYPAPTTPLRQRIPEGGWGQAKDDFNVSPPGPVPGENGLETTRRSPHPVPRHGAVRLTEPVGLSIELNLPSRRSFNCNRPMIFVPDRNGIRATD